MIKQEKVENHTSEVCKPDPEPEYNVEVTRYAQDCLLPRNPFLLSYFTFAVYIFQEAIAE